MKAKSLFLLALAGGCGLVASIGVSQVMEANRSGGRTEETEQILVAAIDIDIGAKVDAQNTKLEDWPKSRIPQNAIRSFDEVKEKYTAARLYPGEAILAGKLMDDQALMPRIPEGFVVIPIKLESDTVMGLIQPGDQVDIMAFLRAQEGVPSTGTYTILQNVRVFTVNNVSSRDVGSDEKAGERSLKTISLLLKPRQAERISLAIEVGKIRMNLRRPTDKLLDDEELVDKLPPLFKADGEIEKEKKVAQQAPPAPVAPTPQVPVPAYQVPAPAAWRMQIHSPQEVRQFEWDDEKEMPHETVTAAAAAAIGGQRSTGVMSQPTVPQPPTGAAFAPPVPGR